MPKHIPHLEEVYIDEGSLGVQKLIRTLKEVSLKVDGAPAVVAGFTQDTPFVSTKSYFNKTPKIYYTEQEIEAGIKSVELQKKLKHLLMYHSYNTVEKDKLNQGDILWWPDNYQDIDGYRVYQPNIIEYRLPLEYIDKNQQMGVIWHSDLSGGGLFTTTEHIWSKHVVLGGFTLPDIHLMDYEISAQDKTHIKTFMHHMYRSLYDIRFINEHFFKWVDEKCLQITTPRFYLNELWNELIKLTLYKNDLLVKLNKLINAETNIQTFIKYKDSTITACDHEGFILLYDTDKYIKIVNRGEFSRLNRSELVKRGFDL